MTFLSEYDTHFAAGLGRIDKIYLNHLGDMRSVGRDVFFHKSICFDKTDFLASLTIACMCGILNNSQVIRNFLNEVHLDSSSKNPNTIVGKLFRHTGDHIDRVGDRFVNRAGGNVSIGFHRLHWGHDILSMHGDNPFSLLIRQYGFGKGLIQAVRHLLADMFSLNGLPLPGSSYFDRIGPEGVHVNLFQEWAKEASRGVDASAREAYESLFTVNVQDVSVPAVIRALHGVYVKSRNIEDESRKIQIIFVSQYITFFIGVASGFARNGVPYINWVLMGDMLVTYFRLVHQSYRDIARLEGETKRLCEEVAQLSSRVFELGHQIPTHAGAEGYVRELTDGANSFSRLCQRLAIRRK